MAREATRTGGRPAAGGVIPGRFALSVGRPDTSLRAGFEWVKLTDVARLESGHTPSRARAEYWGGKTPWVGLRDATANHGKTIYSTLHSITEDGILNSSTRVLPAGTVCLSRTASVGFVVTMGVPMATSQDFVNWVCGDQLNARYLHYLLIAEQDSIRRFAYGTTHQTMYFPEAKALHVALPERRSQDAVAEVLGALDDKIAANTTLAQTADLLLEALFERLLSREGARSVKLRQIAEINAWTASPAPGGTLRYIDIAAVDPGTFAFPAQSRWEEAPSRARRTVRKGDTLWSTVRPNRRSHALNLSDDPQLVASTGLAVLSPTSVGFAYLYEATRRREFTTFLESAAEGSAYPAVRAHRFDDAPVPLLNELDISRFEDIAAPLRLYLWSLTEENRSLAGTRDALLPALMSGRLRVKDVEKIVSDRT